MGFIELDDGTVISSNIQTTKKTNYSDIKTLKDHELYKAIILDTYYLDHEKNVTKNNVEYKIRIVDGEKSGREYENAIATGRYGDTTNFSERIYKKKEIRVDGNQGDKSALDRPNDFDNTYVMIQFLNGYRVPIIIGAWTHPAKSFRGAIEADGLRDIEEFNGIRKHINNDGELILTYYGGKRTPVTPPFTPMPGGVPPLTHPSPENADTGPTQIKVDKTGGVTVIDNELNEIKINRVDKTISVTQYEGTLLPETQKDYIDGYEPTLLGNNTPINEIKLDKDNKTVSVKVFESGGTEQLKAELDGSSGKITLEDIKSNVKTEFGDSKVVTTTSTAILTVDGDNDAIEAVTSAGSKANVSGSDGISLESAAGSILKLAQGKIGIGSDSGELVEEFEKLLTQMEVLIDNIGQITVVGNLGFPTSVPLNSPAFIAIKTQITVINTIITLLKGGI